MRWWRLVDSNSSFDLAVAKTSLAESLGELRDSLVQLSLFLQEAQLLMDSEDRAKAIEEVMSLLESLRRRDLPTESPMEDPD